MTNKSESVKKSPFRNFNAVDLVTLAALAALFRSLDYVPIAFVFPFNTLIMAFGFGLTALVAGAIVRKPGVFTLFGIAAQLINFFVQGETLVAVLMFSTWGLLADLFIYTRLKAGSDPFNARNDSIIASLLMGVMYSITVYGIAFPLIYLVELTTTIYIVLMILGVIVSFLGGLLGINLGNRIKGLLH
jgi:hypothetical protein